MDYWINFARNGDPNGSGLPAWPAYAPSTDLALDFGDEVAVISGLQRDACDLAERIHLADL
jgi:para-nitrobenzyl esterase